LIDKAELKEMFESRLRTVDSRHFDAPQRERDRIRGEIKRMIQNIEPAKPVAADEYQGDF